MSSRADEWMEKLGTDLGLGDLQFSTRGIVEIRFEGGIAVTIERSPTGEALFLHAPLTRIGSDTLAQGALLESLLIMNHTAENPGGTVLALDDSDGELLLTQDVSLAEPAGYDQLPGMLRQFIARAQLVRDSLDQTAGSAAAPPPPMPGEMMFNPNMLV